MIIKYKPELMDELIASAAPDDTITMTGAEFLELASNLKKKSRGRKPIELDDDKFDSIVRSWQRGEMTARAAMQELDLKPNTFYRRVKERYDDMDELRKELKKAAKAEKEELRELKKQVRSEAKEIKKAAREAADDARNSAEETISARKMEREILKEKAAAEMDYKKEMRELKKEVAAEAEAYKDIASEEE